MTVPLRIAAATLGALMLGAMLIAASGASPVAAYAALFGESFFDYWGISDTMVRASPLLLTGLAVIVPMRAGLFNIGGEGQLYLGALVGTMAALALPELPGIVAIPLILLAGAAGGAAWTLLPALLRVRLGLNEVIVTLLLNFVAIHLVSWAVSGPLEAEGAPYPYSEEVSEAVRLPILMGRTDAHAGFAIGVGCAVALYLWMRLTVPGFRLEIVGRNVRAARYAGIDTGREMVRAMLLGGALAGLAGAIEVIGFKYRLFHLFSGGVGYDGIVVAFLAALNPLAAPIAAWFMAALSTGAGTMERAVGVEASVVEVIQGLLVLFVAAALALRTRTAARPRRRPVRPPEREPAK